MSSSDTFEESLLLALARAKFDPSGVYVDANYRVLRTFGNNAKYGFTDPARGEDVRDALPFLVGLSLDEDIELEFLETPNGRCVDARTRRRADEYQVLLTDSTEERDQRQALQQKSNEARLLVEEQRALLARLEELNEALKIKNEETSRLNSLQSRFIANMSHEFRTPLSSIATYAGYLTEVDAKIGAARCAESIARATQHLLNLVDNLIDQAQFEINEIELHPAPFALSDIVADMRGLFEAGANSKGLRFTVLPDGALPRLIEIDETRLRQVFINLIGNAIKYTNDGFVELKISHRDDELCAVITDSGRGISASALATIFDPFTRDGVADVEGAGLGLSITKRLLELMGGGIQIDSAPAAGTRVSVRMAAPLVSAREPQAAVGPGRAVLVVEDDTDVYDVLEIYLDDAGYDVYHADTGAAALDVVSSVQPGSVITDLNLPDMSGVALCHDLRRAQFTGPIVMLTASSLSSDRARAIAAGCTDFVVKPVQPPRLLELLARHYHARAERDSA